MKASDLQQILTEWNIDVFASLGRTSFARNELPADCGAKVYPQSIFDQRPCYCGKFTRSGLFPEALTNKHSHDALAVGAVLDIESDTSKKFEDVVVAVGINYGQFSPESTENMVRSAVDPWRDTRMRPRLEHTFEYLNGKCFGGDLSHRWSGDFGKFHLVAVNFFPWITRDEWTEQSLNAIAEALVLRCWGYNEPARLIAKLVEQIAYSNAGPPGASDCVGLVPFVVFHGAGSVVPYLGMETIRLLLQAKRRAFSNYVFCDNLSRGGRPTNATSLEPLIPVVLRQESADVSGNA